jgi:hypothetical protein
MDAFGFVKELEIAQGTLDSDVVGDHGMIAIQRSFIAFVKKHQTVVFLHHVRKALRIVQFGFLHPGYVEWYLHGHHLCLVRLLKKLAHFGGYANGKAVPWLFSCQNTRLSVSCIA